jgi:hypothetical protein
MKKAIFFLLAAMLILTTSAQAPKAEKTIVLKLSESEVQAVLFALGEQKMNSVGNLYFKISMQADEQLKDTIKKK